MVDKAITYRRFVNVAGFGIAYLERFVGAVLVRT